MKHKVGRRYTAPSARTITPPELDFIRRLPVQTEGTPTGFSTVRLVP